MQGDWFNDSSQPGAGHIPRASQSGNVYFNIERELAVTQPGTLGPKEDANRRGFRTREN